MSRVYHGGGIYKGAWPQSAPAPSADIYAKVSATDTTTDYLNSKIVAGTGISKVILNPGANETLQISATGSSNIDRAADFIHPDLWTNPDDTGTLLSDLRSTPEIRLRTWQMPQNCILSSQLIIPTVWAGGAISAKFMFYMSADSSADTHTFNVGARAIKEDETVDTAIAYSTSMSGTASGTSGKAFFTVVSFTPANSPVAGDGLFFKFKRTDDESGTLRFLGARFMWNIV